MLRHFFEDLTHFDGSFFATFKVMLTKPGFVTEEYVRGRRASYLNPIRMYLFVSAMFFLVSAMLIKPQEKKKAVREEKEEAKKEAKKHKGGTTPSTELVSLKDINTVAQYDSLQNALPDDLKDGFMDAKANRQFFKLMENKLKDGDTVEAIALKKSILSINAETEDVDDTTKIALKGTPINVKRKTAFASSVREYDSIQRALPKDKRNGMIEGYVMRKMAALNEHNKQKDEKIGEKISEKFWHSLPYMLFVTVPLVALILKLLYIRRREYYYVSHLIFTIHFYCFVFVSMLLIDAFDLFNGWGEVIGYLLRAGLALYLYWAMRRFYKQRRAKTMLKFFLFLLLGFLLIMFITAVFGAVALFSAL